MPWTDQKPPADDVLLQAQIVTGKSCRKISFEIDRFNAPDGEVMYRATVGNLFASEEVMRHPDLELVLQWLTIKASEA